jgi:hypothetical protein
MAVADENVTGEAGTADPVAAPAGRAVADTVDAGLLDEVLHRVIRGDRARR